MKKFIFVLSLCMAGLSQAQVALVDSTITYDIDGNYASKLEYQYDSLGRQIDAIGYEWVEDVKVGKDYTQTDYDAQGRKVQETVYRWITTTSEYVSDTRTNYNYAGTSNTIVAIVHQAYVADKGRWCYVDMYQYAYENGRQVLEEHSVMGEDWVSQYKHTWEYAGNNTTLDQVDSLMEATGKVEIYSQTRKEYDAKNRVILSVSLAWNNTNNVTDSITKLINVYSDFDKLLLSEQFDNKNGEWTGTSRTVYEYDDHNTEINKESYNAWKDGVWIGSSKSVHAYIYNGNTKYEVLAENYSVQTNGVWVGSSKTVKTYNELFKNDTIYAYKWNNTNKAWENSQWTIYAYDGTTNNKTLEEIYDWKSGAWKGNSKKEYTFHNGTNKQTLALVYQWVTASSSWAYNTKTEKTYADAKGSLVGDNASYKWDLTNSKWNGTSRTRNTYNAANQNDSIIKYTWAQTEWVNNTLTEKGYTNGKVTLTATYSWIDNAWFGTARTKSSYDGKGNLINEMTSVWKTDHWMDSTQVEHTWSGAKEVFTRTTAWNGERWVMQSQYKYETETNEKGKMTAETEYTCGSDSVWVGKSKNIWKYNTHGDEIETASYTGDSILWVGNDSTAKTYNEQYRILTTAKFAWNKAISQWENVSLAEITYWKPESDKQTSNKLSNWVDNAWQIQYLYEYTYDETGRTIMSAQYGKNGVGSSKNETQYDANGNKTLSVNYQWNSVESTWRTTNKEEWTYDSKNRKIEYTHFYFNIELMELVADKKEKYAFNDAGKQVMNNKYEWLEEDWVLSVRNESVYDNDAEGKLRIKIDGSWTNGVLNSFAEVHYFYNTDPKLRTIVFKNWNDTVLEQQQLKDGETPEYKGETPTKTADAQYTYTFIGWDRDVEVVSKDTFYTAQFSSTLNKYTIYFVNGEDTLQREQLEYGELPEYKGETPTKADTETQYFTFLGWTPDIAEVTEEATYSAEFEAHNKVPTNVEQTEQKVELDLTQPMYNVQGQRVDETYHGIVIQNCRTFLR